jgi:hypothetical protein
MLDDLFLRVERQSFADDSFKILDPQGLVVVGQLGDWSELRWYSDLARICGDDLKWTKVHDRWNDLSAELRRALLRDLRDALITIIDPSSYRLELDEALSEVIGKSESAWTPQFRAWVADYGDKYEMQCILEDSAASRIQEFLEDDGMMLGDPGGIKGNMDPDRSVLTELERTLKKPHNVRLFGARSAAAFPELLDREAWTQAFEELHDMRYVTPRQMFGHLLAYGERTQRVFDEGNRVSVRAISDLKDSIRERLNYGDHFPLLAGTAFAGAVEAPSKDTPMLQAADLAAGYARELYLESGLRVVCEEFKGVILNGAMVRDWSQVQRRDVTQLRTQR